VGRLKHLKRLMVAEAMKQAVEPQGVRRSFLEAAYQEVAARHTQQATMPMTWADLPSARLVRMARAVIVIQRFWRNRKARQANSMHVLDKFARWVGGRGQQPRGAGARAGRGTVAAAGAPASRCWLTGRPAGQLGGLLADAPCWACRARPAQRCRP
jgi:hypothetical protein